MVWGLKQEQIVISASATKSTTITFNAFKTTTYVPLYMVYGGSAQPLDAGSGTYNTYSSAIIYIANRNASNKATITGVYYFLIGF